MNYAQALVKAEKLRDIARRIKGRTEVSPDDYEEFAVLYGELAEVIEHLVPHERIEVPGMSEEPSIHRNYIEAGFMSLSGIFEVQGWMQINALVGRLRQLSENPAPYRPETSISAVIETLRRLRECCQYLRQPPDGEAAVQEIIWIMLRAQFERIDREATLPRFGVRSYKPDFAIPELRLLIEVKFIGAKTNVGDIQEEILADLPGYLTSSGYESVLVVVYDHAQKLRDPRGFIEHIRTVKGILEVLVIPGVGPAA